MHPAHLVSLLFATLLASLTRVKRRATFCFQEVGYVGKTMVLLLIGALVATSACPFVCVASAVQGPQPDGSAQEMPCHGKTLPAHQESDPSSTPSKTGDH